MQRFTRVVLGYHGCEPDFAERVFRGETTIDAWEPSRNPYDWLGHGIYFWEHAPERAKAWGPGGVIGAVIQLGNCLDLTDVRYTKRLARQYRVIRTAYEKLGLKLPENQGKRRNLDCLVINQLVASSGSEAGGEFQTVRSPFMEGKPIYPGSAILRETHIQIAVHSKSCVLGVFRPNLDR